MTKILLPLLLSLTTTYSFAQIDKKQNETTIAGRCNDSVTYRLFSNQSMWRCIKLNTRNGQMWGFRSNMKSESGFVAILLSDVLVSSEKEVNDRFTLYPIEMTNTFILLDQLDGKTWRVQWPTEFRKTAVMPIDETLLLNSR